MQKFQNVKNMRLVERDILIMKELERWNFLLGRQIKKIAGFSGARSCDRRLGKLREAGYIERKKVLYGVPGLYFLTHKGRVLIGASTKLNKIKIEQIVHDILVVDTAIYCTDVYKVTFEDVITEKEMHQEDGFASRTHRPDFLLKLNDKKMCVEIELSNKSKERFQTNLKSNFLAYDMQLWVLPKLNVRSRNMILASGYTDITIIESEVVANHIQSRK